MSILKDLKEVLSDNNDFYQDSIIDEILPKLHPLFEGKKDITQQSIFNNYYQDFICSDIDYMSITTLFEEFLQKQSLRSKREKYLLTHWLYYQAFKVKGKLSQQGLIQFMKESLEKKTDTLKTIEEIAKHLEFGEEQKKQFQQNILKSTAYVFFDKYEINSSSQLSSQKIEQRHRQLIYIIKKMPDCGTKSVEYELQQLILVSFERAYGKKSQEGEKASQSLIDISQFHQKLLSQKRINDGAKKKIQRLKSENDQKNKLGLLQGIKLDLITLDTFLLDYLITLTRKNSEEKGGQPRDIILFVGPSGSGKTTIILKILGYKFQQTQISQLSTYQPINLKPEHDALRTSPESTSTTRYMFSTKIPESSFKPGSYQDLEVCDSPGFEDTAGAEVDISNSISIQAFLKKCNSVKLVVVISQRIIGQKMDGIRNIAKIVSNIVVRYKEIEDNVSFVLNKFERNGAQQKRLLPGIQSILSSLTQAQKNDKQYVAFLNSLSKKLKGKQAVYFNIEDDVQDLLDDIKEGVIYNPHTIFKYSLSSKSAHYISNRRTNLTRLVKDSLGKDNKLALYYLRQLSLLSQCLNYDTETEEEIKNIKKLIREQVQQRFINFQQRIDTEVLQNDVNSNSFEELNKIKEEVKQFQIFTGLFDRLLNSYDLEQKLIEAKAKMLQRIDQLAYTQEEFQSSKQQIINTIKFLRKFDSHQQKRVLYKLSETYQKNTIILDKILKQKRYLQIKAHTIILKNIEKIRQKSREIMIAELTVQQLDQITNKKGLDTIIQKINEQFEEIVEESTQLIPSDHKPRQFISEIQEETIIKVQKNINLFQEIEKEGPILNEIKAFKYKQEIITRISNFAISLIDQLNKYLHIHSKEEDQEKAKHILITKINLSRIKLIKQVYANIGYEIDALWRNFQKFIENQLKNLRQFLDQIKSEKKINKSTLKNFKSRLYKVIKFAHGDDQLVNSTNQLKRQIKKSLAQHIVNLQRKVDKIKITLKLKRTIGAQISKTIELFNQISAFFKTKSLRCSKYFESNSNKDLNQQNIGSNISISKSTQSIQGSQSIMINSDNNDYDDQDSDDEDNENLGGINISQAIQKMHSSIIQKMLKPFSEIKEQSEKAQKKELKTNYFQTLQDFLEYKLYLDENEITLDKEVQRFMSKQEYKYNIVVNEIIGGIKKQLDTLYQGSIEESKPELQIYKLEPQKIKSLKKHCLILIFVKQHKQLQEVFLEEQCCYREYTQKIFEMLTQSTNLLNKQLDKNKSTSFDYIEALSLKQRVQELKAFDTINFEGNKTEFAKPYERIMNDITKIAGKQSSSIQNFFKSEIIHISDLRKMYQYLSEGQFANSQNLQLFNESLQNYSQGKVAKQLVEASDQYQEVEIVNLANQSGTKYIFAFEKAFNFYQELVQFIDQKHLKDFPFQMSFFASQIQNFKLQQKMKHTYEIVKDRIIQSEFIGKQRQFQKIIEMMQRAQTFIEKITDNKLYSKLYASLEQQEKDGQDFKGSKFSERLKYFMNKRIQQAKQIFGSLKIENIQEFIQNNTHMNLYYHLPLYDQQVFNKKLQTIIQQKFNALQASYDKPDHEKNKFQQAIKNIISKVPKDLRPAFKDKLNDLISKLKEKEQAQIRNIKEQIDSSTNFFDTFNKFQKCKIQAVQKQCKIVLNAQLKALEKQMIVVGSDKKMKITASFKAYLKYFGCQNHSIIKRIQNNEKVRDEFQSEQRRFLNHLISEEKDMIREMQNIIIKCSKDQVELFENKCRELNQLYFLAVQEFYEGMCPAERSQLLQAWQNFVVKVQKMLNQLSPSLQINIINDSASKTQKKLIKLQLIRAFIDIFIANSSKILELKGQRFQFAKKNSQLFTKITIDKIAINNLSAQVTQIIRKIRDKNFYDQQIKILNFTSLQSQFERKIVNTLKLLKEYQNIYNTYLCEREQSKFSTKQLTEQVRKKWQCNMQASMKEFEQAVLNSEVQISHRIIVTYNLAQIFTKRRWEVIDRQLQSKQTIQIFLLSKFDQIKQYFQADLENLNKVVKEISNLNVQFQSKKKQLGSQIIVFQNESKIDASNLTKKIQSTGDAEAKLKLYLEYQNIEKLKQQKIEKAKDSAYSSYLRQKEKQDQALKELIRKDIVRHLIAMKKIINAVHWKTNENQGKIIQFLYQVNQKSNLINKILYNELISSNNNYALMITGESDIFKSQAAIQFNKKTANQGIDYLIKNCSHISADEMVKASVTNFYRTYQKQYMKNIDEFKSNPLPQQIQSVARQLKGIKQKYQNSKPENTHPAAIIGKIFGLWSMMKADISNKNDVSINFQPHPAQIVAIFFLVGSGETVKNSLVEVLTGEGKSIVLAGVCSYLAIKGFQPYCACYSEYLSERDNKEFKDLFDRLDISHKIKYGTFNQHCEEIINDVPAYRLGRGEQKMNFREIIKTILTTKAANRNIIGSLCKIFDQSDRKASKKILIIDQADVFFNESFFGQLYYPSISLDNQQTKKLIEFVWRATKESREDKDKKRISKEQICSSDQFNKLESKYPDIKELLRYQVVGMIQAAYNHQHGYIIHNDSIKYRDNDTITDKISYGYRTVFANCYEYERKAVNQLSYRAALKIAFNIAPFSYSQLPTFFKSIIGVSGTVTSISDYKQQILRQKYSIEHIYQIPSIYGLSQRTQDKFTIVKDQELYDKIVEHTAAVNNRPIALFFKTIKDVVNFYKSPQFKEFTKNTTILTEQTDHEVREAIIKGVGQRGKITILTESFARGTDFKIFDSAVEGLGGLHVIQTFISSDLSEYIQTRGRTARQGNRGSFEVLISETELQRFEIDCKEGSQLQSRMKEAWRKKDEVECMNSRERVQKALEKHQKTQALFKKKLTQGDIVEFISSQNKLNEIRENNVKTLIGIDGTVSMGLALRKVFDILENSFSRTKKVLQDKNVVGSFQNQIAIYRNYDSDCDKLLEYSGFEADSQKLKEFLKKISINGGWVNEAMEILFQHANKMDKLDQIIIIADARANTADETVQKRRRRGQSYWVSKGFPIVNQGQELIKIKEKQIKVHTLYINLESSTKQRKAQLKQYCESISKQTGGTSQEFKIKDKNASQFLTGFLVKSILMLIGGQQKGKELVESYNQNFIALRS